MFQIGLYSFDVTLFVIAFCECPYNLHEVDQNDFEGIKNAIEKNELIFPNEDNEYSEMFLNFLKNLLNKDINKRYNIEYSMGDSWVKKKYYFIR